MSFKPLTKNQDVIYRQGAKIATALRTILKGQGTTFRENQAYYTAKELIRKQGTRGPVTKRGD